MREIDEQDLGKQLKVAQRVFKEYMGIPNPIVFENKLDLELIKLGRVLVRIYGDKLSCNR